MEPLHILFVLIVPTSFICVTNSVTVIDLETMGINCPKSISCDAMGDSNFTRRNCECDRDCVKYQDCCFDAGWHVTSRHGKISSFSCMPFGSEQSVGAYVIQTCSKNYSGPEEIQFKCEKQNDLSDPLMASPVTDTMSRTSYMNRYCAECNNVDMLNLQNWNIQMDCDITSDINVGNNFIWQNLIYRHNLNKWGIDINDKFFPCDLNFDIPAYLQSKVRFCRSHVISSCPKTWTRRIIKRDCESYTAVMYVKGGAHVYRNPHCAICNGVVVDAMRCDRGLSLRKKKPFSFALLLDVNRSDGDIVGISRPGSEVCGPNQKYDPYFKKCRNLVCALPGYKMVNGKCKKPE